MQHIPTFFTNTIIYHAIYGPPKIRQVLGRALLPNMKREKELAGQELEFDKSLLGTHAILLTWMAILQ